MEIKDWITLGVALLSALLLIVSWFTINWLNRKNEIAKERLKFRLDILLSILKCCDEAQRIVSTKGIHVNDEDFTLNLLDSLRRMHLFGSRDEINLCESIFQRIGKGEPMGKELYELQNIVVIKLKCELAIDD